jgi:hypothetical protein
MCAGLIFHEGVKKQEIKVFFPRPYAKIYYLTKDGNKDIGIWGIRNEKEKEELKVNLPITGWAKIESIKKGYWDANKRTGIYFLGEKDVKTGIFGAKMKITLINNGPVTIILEKNR